MQYNGVTLAVRSVSCQNFPIRRSPPMIRHSHALFAVCWVLGILRSPEAFAVSTTAESGKLRVLIVDGHNPYHDWQTTTPLMKRILESSGRFEVDVATAPVPLGYQSSTSAPPPRVDNAGFRPPFAEYDVVLGNYVGPRWPAETEADFAAFVAAGGGFVSVHSADNAFPDWPDYNRICGIGGWYGRNERSGPYLYYSNEGRLERDTSAGRGGHHGPQHEYQVLIRDPEHPITRGLPKLWLHTKDELYDSLRGPAESVHVLATAYSDPQHQGTGRHEPMLMTLSYGAGRVFHTVLGHADYSMNCAGFVTTLRRGTEWAATGNVTLGMVDGFPTADASSACESDECLASGRPLSPAITPSQPPRTIHGCKCQYTQQPQNCTRRLRHRCCRSKSGDRRVAKISCP